MGSHTPLIHAASSNEVVVEKSVGWIGIRCSIPVVFCCKHCHNGTFNVYRLRYLMENIRSSMHAKQLHSSIGQRLWITIKQSLLDFKETLALPASLCRVFWNHCLIHYSAEDCASFKFENSFTISYRSFWQASHPFLCFPSLFAAGADLPDAVQLYLYCHLCSWDVYKGRTAFIVTVAIALTA